MYNSIVERNQSKKNDDPQKKGPKNLALKSLAKIGSVTAEILLIGKNVARTYDA